MRGTRGVLGVMAITLLAACSVTGRSTGPASSASSAAAGTSTGAGTVPIKVVAHGPATAELVPVYINNHGPYVFLLDTGSSISCVSPELAGALRLPRTGRTAQVSGVITSARVPLAMITTWKLGDVTLAPGTVALLDVSGTGASVSGLLGSDELSHFGAVTIDFRHQQLRLTQPLAAGRITASAG
jgi:hypothetical protein